jgi:hypothetical protein
MSFEWSDIAIRRYYGEYGIAFNSSSFHLITLTMNSGAFFVIGNFIKPEQFPPSHFERFVRTMETKARHLAASEGFGKFMDEAAAYVRSHLSVSNGLYDPEDAEWWQTVISDIEDGLKLALRETDTYRAARAFDSRVRCLEADIEIIDLMDPILASFIANTDAALGSWVEKAAANEEASIRSRPFTSAAIDRLYNSLAEPVSVRI